MASVLPAFTGARGSPGRLSFQAQNARQTQEPTPPNSIKQEEPRRSDGRNGHYQDPAFDDDTGETHGDEDDDQNPAPSSTDGATTKKRRRSRKGLEKKFECPEEGCGKSYSRAEHLYRHQLNHKPKQVYRCDYPGCDRQFVRLDLRNRHRDRHTSKGSFLNRKDSTAEQNSPTAETAHVSGSTASTSPEAIRPTTTAYSQDMKAPDQYNQHKDAREDSFSLVPGGGSNGYLDESQQPTEAGFNQHDPTYIPGPSHQHHGSVTSGLGPENPSFDTISPHASQPVYPHVDAAQQMASTFATKSNFPPFSLPPSDFSMTTPTALPRDANVPFGGSETPQNGFPAPEPPTADDDLMFLQDYSIPGTVPVFGSETLNKSPLVNMPEDFVTYLFNQPSEGSPTNQSLLGQPNYSNYDFASSYSVPYYGADPTHMGFFPSPGPQQVMAVENLLDQNLPESTLSDEKCNELFTYIRDRFHEDGHPEMEAKRDSILMGDRSSETHLLSRKMMQTYIRSYWLRFSDQLPILHKPTFSPDRTPNLLLIAIITIGAACLDKTYGDEVTRDGAKLSNFLSWHLRWRTFMDRNFRPPAKLWVFQTLILLELYEKMYATREMHERAHIHHATTITLMRRGRSLIGKPSFESPNKEDKSYGSRQSSTGGPAHTPDEWWNHWITNESTRRAAFAAFVIDSIHAAMFGHSTVMVAHEMRLPLPCDEKLWNAPNGAEVGRIEAQIHASSAKPLSFLEGLKRTLSHHSVQTNPFGRVILMAGLLSVSWHMNQRDLQVNSLGGGVVAALGGRDKWRKTLTRAFDFWKSDFDKSLGRGHLSVNPYTLENESHPVYESRIVLHHLAHIAMHVDMVDCQIFARARRLLGRSISAQDLASAQRRMKDLWAPSAKARDAVFYALKFLRSSLLAEDGGLSVAGSPGDASTSALEEPYNARDDVLLNRPWVLYYAALVMWCYGHAKEGPCPQAILPISRRDQVQQMRDYLLVYGSISSPEELETVRGLNENSALLSVLRAAFLDTRWELLREGAELFGNCIQLNQGLRS